MICDLKLDVQKLLLRLHMVILKKKYHQLREFVINYLDLH